MVDQNQQFSDDFPSGFLVKDKTGKFKKVQEDTVVDVTRAPRQATPFEPRRNFTVPAYESQKPKPMSQPISAPLPQPMPSTPTVAAWKPVPAAPITVASAGDLDLEPEELAEIQQHAENIKQFNPPAVQQDAAPSLVSIITGVAVANSLQFENEIYRKRFEKIMESRVRNIRSGIETREILTRAKKVGGLELPPDAAERVTSSIEQQAASHPEFQAAPAPRVDTQPLPRLDQSVSTTEPAVPNAPPSFIPIPKVMQRVLPPAAATPAPQPPQPSQAAVPQSPTAQPEIPVPTIPPQPARPVVPLPQVEDLYQKPVELEMSRIARSRQPELDRPQMVDIRLPVTAVGPIEELGQVDLKEFRRLGNSPEESAEKILEKVFLLEEESWQVKMDGIKAWQRSPVHSMYVDLGLESVRSGRTIDEVIQSLAQGDKPHLIKQEFLAINNLNSMLI